RRRHARQGRSAGARRLRRDGRGDRVHRSRHAGPARREVSWLDVGTDRFEQRDAIVVLGARLGRGDSLTPVLEERVRVAAELFAAGAAPRVIPTGGVTGHARRAEADVLADALVAAGVPREAIAIERHALTTRDNAELVARMVPGARVWLVT